MNERTLNPELSIVLPVYNEAGVVEELVARIGKAAGTCVASFEIVFVNDGSRDDSPELLDKLAELDPRVRVVHLSRNFGHQAAVQAGLAHARGDAVVLMDSDLQDAPEAIPRFIQAWWKGQDVVYAVRAARKEAAWKRCLFAGFHRFLARISSSRIPVGAGNFCLMDRRVVRHIVETCERDRYLPGLRSWMGFRQMGIIVERLARYDNKPRVSLRGLWRLAKTAIFSFSTFPLAVFWWIGYSALAIFLCLAAFSLYCRLFTELAIPGWTSHILSASFFGALNALGISILGEYVVRIYDQVRQRPMYVVDRVVGHELQEETEPASPAADEGQPREGHVSDDAVEILKQATALLAAAESALQKEQSQLEVQIASPVDQPKSPRRKAGKNRQKSKPNQES
jgi:dolichol-phosphate mannosyltransferase